MRFFTLTIFILAFSAISPTRTASGADLVIDWNNVLLDTVRSGSLPPPPATRAMAIMNTAIYDAVNSIGGTHQPYHYSPTSAPDANASKDAAATQAAYQVLSTMFPANLEVYNSALTTSLADIADGANKEAGITLGTEAAMAILSLRSSDGARMPVSYIAGTDPGDWQPTPPAFAAAAVPHWANVRPWTMDSVSQFRQGGPPDLGSDEYAAAFNEVKEIGAADSPTRTEDQTNIAKFWAGPTGTSTPAGQWNRIAQAASEQQGLTLEENARLFAFVGMSQADAVISSWDNKYHYDFWRPVTAIQAADTDGNPETEQDSDWLPLLTTPNFPTYTAAHGTASGATSKILELYFGTDEITFTSSTEGFPEVPDRTFASFSQAGWEGANSRLYGGIHWSFDNEDAFSGGQAIASQMFSNYLQPVPEPSSMIMTLGAVLSGLTVRTRRRNSKSLLVNVGDKSH